MIFLLCGCSEKTLSSAELCEKAIKDSDREAVLSLLNDVVDLKPYNEDLRKKAKEVWQIVSEAYATYEDLNRSSLTDAYAKKISGSIPFQIHLLCNTGNHA